MCCAMHLNLALRQFVCSNFQMRGISFLLWAWRRQPSALKSYRWGKECLYLKLVSVNPNRAKSFTFLKKLRVASCRTKESGSHNEYFNAFNTTSNSLKHNIWISSHVSRTLRPPSYRKRLLTDILLPTTLQLSLCYKYWFWQTQTY